MKCAVCGEKLPIHAWDSMPDLIKEVNPLTFRQAIMHMSCLLDALEQIKEVESKSTIYENRYDEYMSRY